MSQLYTSQDEGPFQSIDWEEVLNSMEDLQKMAATATEEDIASARKLQSAFYSVAYMFFEAKKYEDALSIFDILLAMNPLSTRFQLGAALCHRHMGNNNSAFLLLYRALVGSQLKDPLVLLNYAEMLLVSNNYKEGARALLLAIMAAEKSNAKGVLKQAQGLYAVVVRRLCSQVQACYENIKEEEISMDGKEDCKKGKSKTDNKK